MSTDPQSTPESSSLRSPFVPLLLVIIAWLVWSAFQTDLLVTEHQGLIQLHTLQQSQLEQAREVEGSYLALVTATESLAAQGDANAKLVVDQLKARGIQLPPTQTGRPLPRRGGGASH